MNKQKNILKKSVIYGSEVLSICNAVEDYSRKYPRSEGYPKITAIIKIKADGKDNDIKECFKDEYDGIQSLKNDYNEAIRIRDVNGKLLYQMEKPQKSYIIFWKLAARMAIN